MEARHLKHWPKHLPRHLTVPETSLHINLEVSALRYPDKPALIFFDSRTSYQEFKQQVDLMAGFLQNRCGVRKGDRVLMQMQNSPQFTIAYYAILRADAAVLPVSPMHVTDELLHYFEDGGVSTCFVAQDLYPQIKPLMGKQAQHAIVATYADYLTEYTTTTSPFRSFSGSRVRRSATRVSYRGRMRCPRGTICCPPGPMRMTSPPCSTPPAQPANPKAACTLTAP